MVQEIRSTELEARLKAGEPTLLVDVRHPWERELARLPGDVAIPLEQLPSRADELEIPADALVVVYCHHGVRSISGATFLHRLGIAGAVSLAGGIDAWSQEVDPRVPRY